MPSMKPMTYRKRKLERSVAGRGTPRPSPSAAAAIVVMIAVSLSLPLEAQDPGGLTSRRAPAGGPTRLPDGRPGPGYWQQRVRYRVEATLEPDARRLTGTAWITYHNDSPDTLRELNWHLYQNIFRDQRFGRLATRGITVHLVAAEGVALAPEFDGTLMRTTLPASLPPGDSIHLRLEWEYEVRRAASLRTGSRGRDFGIAQWYPQIAVYDDQRGWDRTPYLGQGEFYLEYGDWDVRISLPTEYLVAATGTLQNPEEVMTREQLARFGAVTSDSVVSIVRPETPVVAPESGARESRARAPRQTAAPPRTRTWHFTATNVRDFAWAASPDYVWDATRTRPTPARPEGTLIYAFYKPSERSADQSAAMARHAIEFFGARFGEYVYPQATVVTGPVGGMEYPMLAFTGVGDGITNQLYIVTAHELGHQWYPMMVGSNETNYPFMDEGFSTFITSLALYDHDGGEGLFNPRLRGTIRDLLPSGDERLFNQTLYLAAARAGQEAPLLTHSNSMRSEQYGVAGYFKPATVLFMLRDAIGAATFDRALRAYYQRWRFKHPYPDDFFNTVEDVVGRDLDGFWNQWFVQTWRLDLALRRLRQRRTDAGWSVELGLENRQRAIMPATLRLTLADGSMREVRVPETAWLADRNHTLRMDSLPARVRVAEIDPDLVLADANRLNNRWPRPRVGVDWRPQILMDLLPPLDRYRIGLRPSLWYASVDGVKLGLAATGSYLATDHRVSALASIGSASGAFSGRLAYGSTLRALGTGTRWQADAFRLDGRSGGGLRLAFAPGSWILGGEPPVRLTVGVHAMEVEDSAYLIRPAEWDRGLVAIGTARFTQPGPRWLGGTVTLDAEFTAPGSDWAYGKASLDLRVLRPVGDRVLLHGRAIGGYASGGVPRQTRFYLAQATPLERFASPWFRSHGALAALGIENEALLGGGGAVIGAPVGASGTKLLAVNLALRWKLFELFADGGQVWSAGDPALRRWTFDAGPAVGLELARSLGPVRLGGVGLSLRAPVYLRDPARPGAPRWDWRWRVVFGTRWGAAN